MQDFPFIRTPDIFVLTVDIETPGLSRNFFRTQWGESTEELCFFDGTLLGLVEPTTNASKLQLSLVPRLDPRRTYPWPTASEFADALSAICDAARSLNLWCEVDADQYPVTLVSDPVLVAELQKQVLAFCRGQSEVCPSFSTGGTFPFS
ncbi:hypothetical protein [Acidovorax sp. Leaf78]|uniref:hypothetical protein n=1 Tax=unclassified Acidovorax TaxID=2684926 RepID=UPI0012E19C1A|nr:hypothetical protein [Acidovorax sp. Leaf78]